MQGTIDAPQHTIHAKSGIWKGSYMQYGEEHCFTQNIQFSDGKLFGEGQDEIGSFALNGTWNNVTGQVNISKQYHGAHAVPYDGKLSPDGTSIQGTYFSGSGTFSMKYQQPKIIHAKSGIWKGSYMQMGEEHSFSQNMQFSDGKLSGDGKDEIGSFALNGTWDNVSGQVNISKQYHGAHTVPYDGKLSPDGTSIQGTYFSGSGTFSMKHQQPTTIHAKSGIWKGSYMQYGEEHCFTQNIQFSDGELFGEGQDEIGSFALNGTWNNVTGQVNISKQYHGAHAVPYDGKLSPDGTSIQGTYFSGSGTFSMKYQQPKIIHAKSGIWKGSYMQMGEEHSFSQNMQFSDGKLSGDGKDEIGSFALNGTWDNVSGQVNISKQYHGAHTVPYDGKLSPDGTSIQGTYFSGSGTFSMKHQQPTTIHAKSGIWKGSYMQYGEEHCFTQNIQFSDGELFGEGQDEIGSFALNGTWNNVTGQVNISKQYHGAHAVPYDGKLSPDGTSIQGTYFSGSGTFSMKYQQPKIIHAKSGIWKGSYMQCGEEHSFSQNMQFGDGKLSGDGKDEIGPFALNGTWDNVSGQVNISKQYHGAHAVPYDGKLSPDGTSIQGTYFSGSGTFSMKYQQPKIIHAKSGIWKGSYMQMGEKHSFSQNMQFGDGKLSGDGKDEIGSFALNGTWDNVTGQVNISKQYHGAHAVPYDGKLSPDGTSIQGTYFSGSGTFSMKYQQPKIINAKSGIWKGSYMQCGEEHSFSQNMQFGDGKLSGDGSDEIGSFTLNGTWDNVTGQVNISKQYHGAHAVPYDGKLSPDGTSIQGTYFSGSGTFSMKYQQPKIIHAKSGIWKGSYMQCGEEHSFSQNMQFGDGKLSGDGSDEIGSFTLNGTWDNVTGQVNISKQYHGAHAVPYDGKLSPDGTSIQGTYFSGSGTFSMKYQQPKIIHAKSGIWKGSYMQCGEEHSFSQNMQFGDGKLSGDGSDEIGSFTLNGTWDNVTGQVNISKQYHGAHAVPYDGKLSPDGTSIQGTYFSGSGTFSMKYQQQKIPEEDYHVDLKVNVTTQSSTSALYLDLFSSFWKDGEMQACYYDKCDDFNFNITNFLFLSSNSTPSPSYDVLLSQLTRFASAYYFYGYFIRRAGRLANELLTEGYVVQQLQSFFQTIHAKSGLWKGSYMQYGEEHYFTQNVQFSDGKLFGEGKDEIGYFALNGTWDNITGQVNINKQYHGAHAVPYDGKLSPDGTSIQGTYFSGSGTFSMKYQQPKIIHAKSGIWKGSYMQCGEEHSFSQNMQFGDGKLSGDGKDEIGSFTLNGTWDNVTGQVNISKQYHGAHTVPYDGKLSPDGTSIQGTYFSGSGTFSMKYQQPKTIHAKSGIWKGSYMQYGEEHCFTQNIQFSDGKLAGDGKDGIGSFALKGSWDNITGQVSIRKQYHGAHAVPYDGKLSPDGTSIQGTYFSGAGTFSMKYQSIH